MPKLTSKAIIYRPTPNFTLTKVRSKVSGFTKTIKTLVRK